MIDDEPVLGYTARLLLEAYGHEVVVGDDGLWGIGPAQDRHPDAIAAWRYPAGLSVAPAR